MTHGFVFLGVEQLHFHVMSFTLCMLYYHSLIIWITEVLVAKGLLFAILLCTSVIWLQYTFLKFLIVMTFEKKPKPAESPNATSYQLRVSWCSLLKSHGKKEGICLFFYLIFSTLIASIGRIGHFILVIHWHLKKGSINDHQMIWRTRPSRKDIFDLPKNYI